MKLYCSEAYLDFNDLFTTGKFYDVNTISPNKLMVSVVSNMGDECRVVYQNSVYGKFILMENQ